MGERDRLCVACSCPSPGPSKRLYYQHRDFGPFFPILEEQRRKSNSFLFSAGRAVVCTGCANHLLRQWSAFEQKWTPLPRRTYSLLSDEREAKKSKKSSASSEIHMYDLSTARSPKMHYSRSKMLPAFNADAGFTNGEGFSHSFITEDASPFRRAVKQVTKQNTRVLNETSKIADVLDTVMTQNLLAKPELETGSSDQTVRAGNEIIPRNKTPLALMSVRNDDLRCKVREELQENVEVMIRKLAEIQHVENMRRYEQELQEAAQRICRAQDRESDIERMCRNLKRQLQEELMFRDMSRVLRDSEQTVTRSANAAIQTSEPLLDHAGIESVTAAKKIGSEWKGKVKITRNKVETNKPKRKPHSPLRTQSETLPRDVVKDHPPQPRSAQNIDALLRELEQEREWRKKTESAMQRQHEMINELRKGIQGDVQRLIDEQNRRYQELKAALSVNETKKTHGTAITERKATSAETTTAMIACTQATAMKPNSWRRSSDDEVNSIHSDDSEPDRTDDDNDDSHDEDSAPRTPEYYIN